MVETLVRWETRQSRDLAKPAVSRTLARGRFVLHTCFVTIVFRFSLGIVGGVGGQRGWGRVAVIVICWSLACVTQLAKSKAIQG